MTPFVSLVIRTTYNEEKLKNLKERCVMPIINTNMFWNYIINESESVVDRAKQILTREDKDYQTGKVTKGIYYQFINEFEIDFEKWTTLRFPAGLTKYLSKELMIPIEDKERKFDSITKEDVYKKAYEISKISPKYEVRDYQIDAVYSSLFRFTSLIQATTGSGKGQPLSLVIPTPNGDKKIGDLKIGDEVFGSDGKSTKITGIFPQGMKSVYKVRFRSGRETYCDDSHLWTFETKSGRVESPISTRKLLETPLYKENKGRKHYRYYCLKQPVVEYSEKQYEIPPYLLGVILGDGSCLGNYVSIYNPDIDKDIRDKIKTLVTDPYYIKEDLTHKSCPRFYISLRDKYNRKEHKGYIHKIKDLKLNCVGVDKFIPEEYFYGSVEQRLELLRGLMDTDGSCSKRKCHSSTVFNTSSKKLLDGVKRLVFSLGGSCYIQKVDNRHKHDNYSMTIQMDLCPFYTKRKADNWTPYKTRDYLESIEYDRDEETLCIKVSNEDELYLTSDYVLTHNTSIMCLLIELLKNKKVLITNGNNFILQQIYDRLVSFGETDISWNKTKDPDYTKRIIIINTSSSDVRLNEQNQDYINFLKTVQLWCIDEASHFQSITNFEPIFYMDPDVLEHVVGYTATPFRDYKSPYSDPLDFTLIALLGEPAFVYEMKDTIADKNIAQPYSYFVRYKNIPAKLPPWLADNYFMQYRSNITCNKNRNAAGFAIIKFLNEYNIKTLVSFNNIKPGQRLLKQLAEDGVKALFICGSETIYEYKQNKRGTFKLEERKGNVDNVKEALDNGYNVILASQVFDEGVDIEIFQAAILFSAGKSPIKILQVSGRASRKKAVHNVSFIIDFRDIGGHYIFENQYQKRKQLLEDSGIKNIEDVHKFMDMIKEIGYKSTA